VSLPAGGADPLGVTFAGGAADVAPGDCIGGSAGPPDEPVAVVDLPSAPAGGEPAAELEPAGAADVAELGAPTAAEAPDFALVDSLLTANAAPVPSAATPITAATSGVPNRFARGNRTDETPRSVFA
jgi:hypothetical protein